MLADTRLAHTEQQAPPTAREARPWWRIAVGVGIAMLSLAALVALLPAPTAGSPAWWAATLALHAPFWAISAFLAAGLVERIGFLWRGRRLPVPGSLPSATPASRCRCTTRTPCRRGSSSSRRAAAWLRVTSSQSRGS